MALRQPYNVRVVYGLAAKPYVYSERVKAATSTFPCNQPSKR